MYKIEKYIYDCDGGSLAIANSLGSVIKLNNGVGDGSYSFFVIHCSGWGPAFYKNKEEYEKLKNFLNEGWKEYEISLNCDEKWKALFHDFGSYKDEGVEIKGDFLNLYHRIVETEDEEDAQILIVVYHLK